MKRLYEFGAIGAGVACMLLAGFGVLAPRWTWPLLVVGCTIVALAAWLTGQAAADRRAELNTNRVLQAIDSNGSANRLAVDALTTLTERRLAAVVAGLDQVRAAVEAVHDEVVDVLAAPVADMRRVDLDDAPDFRPPAGYTSPGEDPDDPDDPDPPTTTFPVVKVTDPCTVTAPPDTVGAAPDPRAPLDPLDPTWTWGAEHHEPAGGDMPGPALSGWQADPQHVDSAEDLDGIDSASGWVGPGWDRQNQGGRR